jgi:hypothetical protein
LAAAWLSWRTVGVVGVAAAAMVLGGELLLNPVRSPTGTGHEAKEANNNPNDLASPVQVAMVTIANRDLLLEPLDVRLRGDAGRSSTGNANPRKAPRHPRVLYRGSTISRRRRTCSPARWRVPGLVPRSRRLSWRRLSEAFKHSSHRRMSRYFLMKSCEPGSRRQQPADELLKGINIKTSQTLAPGYFVTLRP